MASRAGRQSRFRKRSHLQLPRNGDTFRPSRGSRLPEVHAMEAPSQSPGKLVWILSTPGAASAEEVSGTSLPCAENVSLLICENPLTWAGQIFPRTWYSPDGES
jgi:hypothetical protein